MAVTTDKEVLKQISRARTLKNLLENCQVYVDATFDNEVFDKSLFTAEGAKEIRQDIDKALSALNNELSKVNHLVKGE